MIYRTIVAGLDEDDVLRVDAILGDPAARAEVDRQRSRAALDAGFEVG